MTIRPDIVGRPTGPQKIEPASSQVPVWPDVGAMPSVQARSGVTPFGQEKPRAKRPPTIDHGVSPTPPERPGAALPEWGIACPGELPGAVFR
jgi:hypothetical protein